MKSAMKTAMEIITTVSNGRGEVAEPEPKRDLNQNDFGTDQRVADLENRPSMPASGTGIENDILQLDEDLRPRWKAALIPSGTTEGDMLVWDDTLEKWIVFTSSIDLILMWSASLNKWQQVEVPATDGVILQTYTPVSGEPPLKFDILRFTV